MRNSNDTDQNYEYIRNQVKQLTSRNNKNILNRKRGVEEKKASIRRVPSVSKFIQRSKKEKSVINELNRCF